MKHRYTNFLSRIFEGFYESNLYNSDTLYNQAYDMNIPEGYVLDIDDFEKYQNEVGQKATSIIWNMLPEDIIQDMKFVDVYSPQYYNFETDKLIIDVDFSLELLEDFCYNQNKNDFDNYLHRIYSSRDGFISFVPNNIEEFKSWDDNRKIDVMIEYYLLETVDFEDYQCDLYDSCNEILYNHLCLVDEKTDDMYNYHYDENDNVIVDEKIIK